MKIIIQDEVHYKLIVTPLHLIHEDNHPGLGAL